MQTVVIDSMELEERFPDFEVRNELTGSIHTLVAVKDDTEYIAFVGKQYGEHLMKQKEVNKMSVENPILYPTSAEVETHRPVAKCHYKHCEEVLYKGEGYVFDGELYCCTSCIGEQLIEEGEVIEAGEVA